ncbi:hypothetical protein BDV11DRAFT_188832 [Aspergillus similis]
MMSSASLVYDICVQKGRASSSIAKVASHNPELVRSVILTSMNPLTLLIAQSSGRCAGNCSSNVGVV